MSPTRCPRTWFCVYYSTARKQQERSWFPFRNFIFTTCNQKCKKLPQIQFLSCLTSDVILWSGLSTVWSSTFNLKIFLKLSMDFETFYSFFDDINQSVYRYQYCLGISGYGIRCFFDPWIQNKDPGSGMEEIWSHNLIF
jgi:hypothetical protein